MLVVLSQTFLTLKQLDRTALKFKTRYRCLLYLAYVEEYQDLIMLADFMHVHVMFLTIVKYHALCSTKGFRNKI